jgi:hypothetical protein
MADSPFSRDRVAKITWWSGEAEVMTLDIAYPTPEFAPFHITLELYKKPISR